MIRCFYHKAEIVISLLYLSELTRRATYKHKVEARLRKHCCCGKAIIITYSECVFVALAIQHAQRMSRIIFSSLACLFQPYYSTLLHKRHEFRKKVIKYALCV
jgi:hypothetical protein